MTALHKGSGVVNITSHLDTSLNHTVPINNWVNWEHLAQIQTEAQIHPSGAIARNLYQFTTTPCITKNSYQLLCSRKCRVCLSEFSFISFTSACKSATLYRSINSGMWTCVDLGFWKSRCWWCGALSHITQHLFFFY